MTLHTRVHSQHAIVPRDAQEFFNNVKDKHTPDGIWFKGIKANMKRMIAQRKSAKGESFDQSANELYLPHIRDLSAALARADHAEAAGRNLGTKTAWRATGDASEPSALTYNALSNDIHTTPHQAAALIGLRPF